MNCLAQRVFRVFKPTDFLLQDKAIIQIGVPKSAAGFLQNMNEIEGGSILLQPHHRVYCYLGEVLLYYKAHQS